MDPITPTPPVAAPVESVEPTAPVVPEPKEKDQFAEKLELLSRRERQIYRQRMEIEARAKQLEAEKADIEKFKTIKTTAKQNPLRYLQEAGLTYDEITQFVLNGGQVSEKSELEALRDEFRQMREAQESKEKQAQESQTQAQRQAEEQRISEFKDEITEFIENNKATYELSSMRDATDDIFTTINDAYVISLNEWHKNGRVGRPPGPMQIKEAADIVEEFYEKEVLRLTESQKLKAKLNPQPTESGQQSRQPSKTLTNNMASTAASVVPAKTDNDRMQRALAKLSGP